MEIHESFVLVFVCKGGEIEFEAILYLLFEQTKSKSKPTLSVHVETEIVSHTVRVYLGGV